jgi:hypothetical protein
MTVLLYEPKRVQVRTAASVDSGRSQRVQPTLAGGRPVAVGNVAVETVREEWLVEDRWWTPEPIRRHYYEVALADGRCEVVFRDKRGWFRQRA